MFKLKDVLPVTLKSMGLTKKYNAQSVIVHWQEIVGEEISSHSWPISVERNILFLAVNNSVWSHHLMMLKPVIMDKINKFLNEKLICDIRFQAGDLKKYQNQQDDGENIAILQPTKLTADELADIWQTTEVIQDDSIRKKCYYVLIKQTAITKTKQKEGWKACKNCSVLLPPAQDFCTACSIEHKQEKIQSLIKLLKEAPWLSYLDTCQFVACSPREFHATKKGLVHKLIRALFEPGWDKLNEAVLVMLMTGITPDRINQSTIDTVIGKIKVRLAEKVRRKKYVSAPGR